eukprot:5521374-Amphidinium_carterae.2
MTQPNAGAKRLATEAGIGDYAAVRRDEDDDICEKVEPDLKQIHKLLLSMKRQLVNIPAMSANIQYQQRQLSDLEARLAKLEARDSLPKLPAPSLVGVESLYPSTTLTASSTDNTPATWIAGGWQNQQEMEDALQELKKLDPAYLECWTTKATASDFKGTVFFKLATMSARNSFHLRALPLLRDRWSHVWVRHARSPSEELGLRKAHHLKKLVEQQVQKEKLALDANLLRVRSRD